MAGETTEKARLGATGAQAMLVPVGTGAQAIPVPAGKAEERKAKLELGMPTTLQSRFVERRAQWGQRPILGFQFQDLTMKSLGKSLKRMKCLRVGSRKSNHMSLSGSTSRKTETKGVLSLPFA